MFSNRTSNLEGVTLGSGIMFDYKKSVTRKTLKKWKVLVAAWAQSFLLQVINSRAVMLLYISPVWTWLWTLSLLNDIKDVYKCGKKQEGGAPQWESACFLWLTVFPQWTWVLLIRQTLGGEINKPASWTLWSKSTSKSRTVHFQPNNCHPYKLPGKSNLKTTARRR